MNKLIGFPPEIMEQIQTYANDKFEGNFNMAVRVLCGIAIKSEAKS